MKASNFIRAAAHSFILPLASCLQTEMRVQVSNDLSGKFVYSETMDLKGMNALMAGDKGAAAQSPEVHAEKFASFVKYSKGVDVWSNFEQKATAQGITYTVTGYAKDVNLLKIANSAPQQKKQANPADDIQANPKLTKLADGTISMEHPMGKGLVDKMPIMSAASDKPVTKEELDQIKGEMQKSESQMAMMKPMLSGAKIAVKYNFGGGKVKSDGVFNRINSNTLGSEVKLEALLDGMTSVMKEAFTIPEGQEATKATIMENFKKIQPKMVKTIFGKEANPTNAVIIPGADAFPYAAETAKAKAAQPGVVKQAIADAAKLPDAPAP